MYKGGYKIDDYLDQGVDAAASARDQVSDSWSDTWKNFATQYALAQMQNDYNRSMSDLEYKRNIDMWNMMNEYNTPAAQMARFKEAGLNPMLIYGQGTPGNASGAANVPSMKAAAGVNAQITPSQDIQRKVAMASQAVGMISNVAENVTNLIDQGLNVRLKQNQLVQSDIETKALTRTFGNTGQVGQNMAHLDETLNPLSQRFDPLAFIAWQKVGKLPGYVNQFMTDDLRRLGLGASTLLTTYRANYQKYYNENLLPKFNEYQQGKIDLQALELEIEKYNKTSLEMLPPELRGILEPLVSYIAPFIKFIFKNSQGKFIHHVH